MTYGYRTLGSVNLFLGAKGGARPLSGGAKRTASQ